MTSFKKSWILTLKLSCPTPNDSNLLSVQQSSPDVYCTYVKVYKRTLDFFTLWIFLPLKFSRTLSQVILRHTQYGALIFRPAPQPESCLFRQVLQSVSVRISVGKILKVLTKTEVPLLIPLESLHLWSNLALMFVIKLGISLVPYWHLC